MDYGWEGWNREPPEGEEIPDCPECGGGMSDFVYRFDGLDMCEDCYRQMALEHINDLTTMELAEILKDEIILKEKWYGN